MAFVNPTERGYGLVTRKPSILDAKLKVLIYSESGVGKTVFCKTAEGHKTLGPLLFVNAEGGINSLYPDPPEIYDLIDPDDPDPDTESRAEKALTRFEHTYWVLKSGRHPWKTVAIDSLSEVIRYYHDYLARKAVDAGKRASIHETTLPDYNFVKNYLTHWIRRFRDLPMNVIVTLHAEQKQRADGVDQIQPLVFDKLQKPLEQMFDIVGYLMVGEARRAARPGEDPAQIKPEMVRKMIVDYQANDRLEIKAKWRMPANVPPPPGGVLINPTLPKIWRIMVGDAAKIAQPAEPATKQGDPNGTKE